MVFGFFSRKPAAAPPEEPTTVEAGPSTAPAGSSSLFSFKFPSRSQTQLHTPAPSIDATQPGRPSISLNDPEPMLVDSAPIPDPDPEADSMSIAASSTGTKTKGKARAKTTKPNAIPKPKAPPKPRKSRAKPQPKDKDAPSTKTERTSPDPPGPADTPSPEPSPAPVVQLPEEANHLTPEDVVTDPSKLYALISSVPAQTLHTYTLTHLCPPPLSPFPLHPSTISSSPYELPNPNSLSSLTSLLQKNTSAQPTLDREPPSPATLTHLTRFFASLTPPPKLHCVRCHKAYFELENNDTACRVPHDDDSAIVERVKVGGGGKEVGEYETLWGCCGRTVEGDGDMGPPDGWCYEGAHTTDTKRARFRADSSPQDDKLTTCVALRCHGPLVHTQPTPSSRSPRSVRGNRTHVKRGSNGSSISLQRPPVSAASGSTATAGRDSVSVAESRKRKRSDVDKGRDVFTKEEEEDVGDGEEEGAGVITASPRHKPRAKPRKRIESTSTKPRPSKRAKSVPRKEEENSEAAAADSGLIEEEVEEELDKEDRMDVDTDESPVPAAHPPISPPKSPRRNANSITQTSTGKSKSTKAKTKSKTKSKGRMSPPPVPTTSTSKPASSATTTAGNKPVQRSPLSASFTLVDGGTSNGNTSTNTDLSESERDNDTDGVVIASPRRGSVSASTPTQTSMLKKQRSQTRVEVEIVSRSPPKPSSFASGKVAAIAAKFAGVGASGRKEKGAKGAKARRLGEIVDTSIEGER